MRLRRMILRRKTDPKTGKRTLSEPAQPRRTWTCHRAILYGNLQGKCRTRMIKHRGSLTLTVRTPSVWPH